MVLVHFTLPSVSKTVMAFSPATPISGCPSSSKSAIVGAPPQPLMQPPGMVAVHSSEQSSSSRLTLPWPDTTISPLVSPSKLPTAGRPWAMLGVART